jgi:hypothetical protein
MVLYVLQTRDFQNYEIFKNTSFLDERQQIILFYFLNIWKICKKNL